MALKNKQRKLVFAKSNGRCWYCGCELPEKGWHADHLKPVIRTFPVSKTTIKTQFGEVPEHIKKLLDDKGMANPQNDTIENIVPACAPCNLFKSVFSVEEFRTEIQQQVHRARKTSVNFRTAERFGMIQINIEPIKFWFETEDL
jgi:hypothetical protein